MAPDPGSHYDSFVLRLWRSAADGRVLRVEIDHVQTGAVHIGRDVPPEWILTTLTGAAAPAPPASEGDRADPEGDIDEV